MGEQLSIIRLIVEASVPVQIVIAILMLASLTSWAIIFRKRLVINRARRGAESEREVCYPMAFHLRGGFRAVGALSENRGDPRGSC